MKTKKLFSCLALTSALGSLVGCGANGNDGINIVCTIFPEYEFVNEISKGVEGINVRLLVNTKVDMHSYQPSVDDIVAIKNSDLFVYVGGESDKWVENTLEKNNRALNLIEALGNSVKEEEDVEGMEEEHEEEHEEDAEFDEHVWLSLVNAQKIVKSVKDELVAIDPDHAEMYNANYVEYNEKLVNLHSTYQTKLAGGTHNTVVFADRFPFRYMVDDYGFDYYAAFKGCSAESEASFETIIFLANKIDELGNSYILKTTTSTDDIAKSVKNNTTNKNQEIVSMCSLEIKENNNDTYLSVMESNLETLYRVTR